MIRRRMQSRFTATLFAALLGAFAAFAHALPGDVGPNTSDAYVKECGACHFPYQPGFLPARSWRKIMGSLARHFGESAELKSVERDEVTAYLVAGAADFSVNKRSQEVMHSVKSGETPERVTGVLYVGGIHGGFLDPAFRGSPPVKTLADCSACHPRAADGRFAPRNYVITDEQFRRP